MRTEYRSRSRTVDCPLLFSVAMKRVTIYGQRFDLYKRIRRSGNVFQLTVVIETSVYLVVAHQRTSGSGSTIPTFRRHVTTRNVTVCKLRRHTKSEIIKEKQINPVYNITLIFIRSNVILCSLELLRSKTVY
jgi:hypothetical protein